MAAPTSAEYASVFPTDQGYGEVLWANSPGGEVTFGFSVHNGGPVPVTLLGVTLRTFAPGIADLLEATQLLIPDRSAGLSRSIRRIQRGYVSSC